MIDSVLRPSKDAALAPIVRRVPRWLGPGWLTAAGLLASLGAAALAAGGTRAAVVLFLVGRLLDGVDGALARARGTASDFGGYLDIVADTVGYAAVPIGLAVADGSTGAWAACAVLLGTFYVNAVSWTYLAAVREKRGARVGDDSAGSEPSISIPTGLVEGGETIVFYTAMLVWPSVAPELSVAMAVLVALTVVQRLVWAGRTL